MQLVSFYVSVIDCWTSVLILYYCNITAMFLLLGRFVQGSDRVFCVYFFAIMTYWPMKHQMSFNGAFWEGSNTF